MNKTYFEKLNIALEFAEGRHSIEETDADIEATLAREIRRLQLVESAGLGMKLALDTAISAYQTFLLRGDIDKSDAPRAKSELDKMERALRNFDKALNLENLRLT